MGRIDHRATHRERDFVRSGNPARNVGFHVNCDGAGFIVQSPLIRGKCNGGIDAYNFRVHRTWKHVEETTCPSGVHRKEFLPGSHPRSNDPVSCTEMRCKPACNPEAYDTQGAPLDSCLERVNEPRGLIAENRHPRSQGDPGLQRKRGDGDNGRSTGHFQSPPRLRQCYTLPAEIGGGRLATFPEK